MRKNVLLVEDDRDIRDPMLELLDQEGFSVVCASSGREALEILERGPLPGVILCDLMMPNMTGTELIRHIKAKRFTPEPAIMILSAAAHAEKTALDLGVGYLQKPIDIDALLQTIQRHCGK